MREGQEEGVRWKLQKSAMEGEKEGHVMEERKNKGTKKMMRSKERGTRSMYQKHVEPMERRLHGET